MPFPARIDRERIVLAARELIEQHGVEVVKLHHVAAVLGVKAPSLYRHVKNRNALLLAVNELTVSELHAALLDAANTDGTLIERLLKLATAYRTFAHEHPVCYALSMRNDPAIRPSHELQVQLVLPFQGLFAQIAREDISLAALRGAYAFLHGWVSLEIGQHLRRGGDLTADFEQSFRAFLEGWQP